MIQTMVWELPIHLSSGDCHIDRHVSLICVIWSVIIVFVSITGIYDILFNVHCGVRDRTKVLLISVLC
jgi:hypothetical protein